MVCSTRRSSDLLAVVISASGCDHCMEKTFTQIEANAGMAERLVRDLAIEEALQE